MDRIEYRIVGYIGTDPVQILRPIHKSIPNLVLAEHALLHAQLENLADGRYDRIELQERTPGDWQ